MSGSTYLLLDTALHLQAPGQVQAEWDRVYGAFAVAGEGSQTARSSVVRVQEQDADGRCFCEVDGEGFLIPGKQVLCLLQHVLLNRLLARSERFMVWHGAAWSQHGGIMAVLGDSCLGKTTMALAAQQQGCTVYSDEMVAVERATGLVHSFPRSMLARPDAASLAGVAHSQETVCFEEVKEVYPLQPLPPARLTRMVHMAWPLDPQAAGSGAVMEWEVSGPAEQWQAALAAVRPDVRCRPHPDDGNWWRLESDEPLPVPLLEEVLRSCGMVLRGYHNQARRRPDYSRPPHIVAATPQEMTGKVLSSLINGRTLLTALGAAQVLIEVRSLLQTVETFHCVPGRLVETLKALGACK